MHVGDWLVDTNSTLHSQIIARLRTLLINGEFAHGVRIPEADLCDRFNVSRTPLREALKVLAVEGFIELRPNRGAIVAPIDPVEIGHVLEFKSGIERQIGLLAAVRASREDVAAMEAIHSEMGTSIVRSDPVLYTELNQRFHNRLAQATHNPILLQTYDNLQLRILRVRFTINDSVERLDASYAEHEMIMMAFRAKARLDLAERLEEHNRSIADAVIKAVEAMKLREHVGKLHPVAAMGGT